MKITNVSLFMLLSLYTIQSYGMEKNFVKSEAQVRKHAKNSIIRVMKRTYINAINQTFKKQHENISLNSKDKILLKTSLEKEMQDLRECYSLDENGVAETWSLDDINALGRGMELIESLKKS